MAILKRKVEGREFGEIKMTRQEVAEALTDYLEAYGDAPPSHEEMVLDSARMERGEVFFTYERALNPDELEA